MIVKEKQQFKTSVNIKYDFGKPEFFNRYLPTPSHADSILGILRGFNDPQKRRSHIIIGPYGTGKSLIGTIISGIISKEINKRPFNNLKKKFNNVDDDVYNELTKTELLTKQYIPVILNGNEGRFRQAILSSIIRTLEDKKIEIQVPGVVSKIMSSLEQWQTEFPKTYKEFKKHLKEHNKDLKIWRLEVLNQNPVEIAWFKDVYPLLTSGAQFIMDYSDNFNEQMKVILDELKQKSIGLFIVYDEFGRFLQNLDTTELYETMQDLQDIAEIADHYTDDLHLLFITHRNLRHYFGRFKEEFQQEFQRIEKRYQTYYIDSDSSTFIRLTESILSSYEDISPLSLLSKEKTTHYLRKYPLFPELNQVEIEKVVVKGTYPIHPVTLFLLPYLSSVFGQNERTLFTFLESLDSGGLLNHIEKIDQYYLPYQLFDYFFPDLKSISLKDSQEDTIKSYQRVINKLPKNRKDYSADKIDQIILKFFALWELVGLQSKFKLTSEFISFSLHMEEDRLSSVLKRLSFLKCIRFNRILGYWEIFEGSSYDIDQLIEEELAKSSNSLSKKTTILYQHLKKNFFLANKYNDRKSMTRFASVNLTTSYSLLKDDEYLKKIHQSSNPDVIVHFVILGTRREYDEVIDKIKNLKDNRSIFCVSNISLDMIEKEISDYQIVNHLLQNQDLLKTDKNLEDELKLRREDLSFLTREFIHQYSSFSKDLRWMYQGEFIQINNEIMLENTLSDIMFKVFPDTPEVRNDSYNRRKINSVQQKAGNTVVDHILQYPKEETFNIEGNGPDYLVYATIFKNNALDLNCLDELPQGEFRKLREVLIGVLETKEYGKLSVLAKVMKAEPFGIREPLIPIFLVALLRDKWEQLMFYRNDMFVSGINGEKLFKMMEEADQYEYHYYNYDEDYDQFFNLLIDEYSPFIRRHGMNNPKPLMVVEAMLVWLRSLPKAAQINTNLDVETINLRDAIKHSEVDPRLAIDNIYSLYKDNYDRLTKNKMVLEEYNEKHKEDISKKVLNIVGVKSSNELKIWAKKQSSNHRKNNRLVKFILEIDPLLSKEWIEELGNKFVGIDIEDWSDTTNEMFLYQIEHEFKSISEPLSNSSNYTDVIVNGEARTINKVELSTKTETIYKNVHRMISNGGRTVPKKEIEYMVLKLIEEFVD